MRCRPQCENGVPPVVDPSVRRARDTIGRWSRSVVRHRHHADLESARLGCRDFERDRTRSFQGVWLLDSGPSPSARAPGGRYRDSQHDTNGSPADPAPSVTRLGHTDQTLGAGSAPVARRHGDVEADGDPARVAGWTAPARGRPGSGWGRARNAARAETRQ
jgi:hypothetical protein